MEYDVQTMEMGGGDELVEWNQITTGDFRLMAEDRTLVGVSLNLLSYLKWTLLHVNESEEL